MRMFSFAAILATAVTPAFAQSIADQVISRLTAEGYTRIEVKNGPSQVKVEAIRGNRELEIIYDSATGAILKQEVNAVRAGEETRTGVSVRTEDRDFLRNGDGRDDDDSRGRDEDRDDRRDDDDDDDDDDRGDRDDDKDRRDRDDDDDDDDDDNDDDDDDNDDDDDDDDDRDD